MILIIVIIIVVIIAIIIVAIIVINYSSNYSYFINWKLMKIRRINSNSKKESLD